MATVSHFLINIIVFTIKCIQLWVTKLFTFPQGFQRALKLLKPIFRNFSGAMQRSILDFTFG